MYDENNKFMFKMFQKDDVYVVKYIVKKLNEFALSAMCQWCEYKTVYFS